MSDKNVSANSISNWPKPIRISREPLTQHLRRFVGRKLLDRLGQRARQQQLPRMAVFAHDEIGDWVVIDGRYEADLLDAIKSWLLPRALPDHTSMIALDIGANIGNHALALAPSFARVLAFEPNPIAVHLLQANVEVNQAANVEVLPFGLGHVDETLPFQPMGGNLGAGHFLLPGAKEDPSHPRLTVRNGDTFIESYLKDDNRRIGLLKLDVEGMEMTVVQGLAKTLTQHKPLILFEVAFPKAGAETATYLRELGYKYFFSLERPSSYSAWVPVRAAARLFRGADIFLSPVDFNEGHTHSLVVASATTEWLPCA